MFLHLVAFDIPYPPDYGGAIVVFNRIRALHGLGARIILHCFQYGGRQPARELEQYCHEVHYYPRSRSVAGQFGLLPFIMRTRRPAALLRRLCLDEHPILFEGMHTAAFVWHKALRQRRKVVMMHNVEWQYYAGLARLSAQPWRKLYFRLESARLRRVEAKVARHADVLTTLSAHDHAYYLALQPDTRFIPAFHSCDRVESFPGRGNYVLFHGKLSVPDNDRAARWLIAGVFDGLDVPLVIAGKDPSAELKALAASQRRVCLVENPGEAEMDQLMSQAHVHLLISFQSAGVKLKLIHALFRGRFCVANDAMVSGSGLEALCCVENTAAGIRKTVETLMRTPFEPAMAEARRATLEAGFSNRENGRKLLDLVRKNSVS
jgi:hypothetical protein